MYLNSDTLPDLVEAWEEIFILFRKQLKWILGVLRPWYQSECWWFTREAGRKAIWDYD
jgi:hypothetical protein